MKKKEKQFIVKESCLFCSKKFEWGQQMIIKAPVGACFCMDCIDKFIDKNEYDAYNAWISHDYQGKEIFDFQPSRVGEGDKM